MQDRTKQLAGWSRRVRGLLPRSWRGALPLALVVAGLALLAYVGTQYASMYMEQRRLARQWEQEQQTPAVAHASEAAPISDDGLTRISIPKINLSAVVVEGTTHRALLLGPGHIKETAEPGEAGNAVITAHRDTFFRHIYELNKGDTVEVQRRGKIYKYQVTGKKIVDPNDVSVIQPSRENRLTLITCYPTYFIGPAPERLVVFSKLAETPDAAGSQPSLAPAAAAMAATAK